LSTIDSVCLSVRLSVCHKLQIVSSFLFFDGIEPFFGRQFSMTPLQNYFIRYFLFRPITPNIYSPKLHKIAYNSACMADRPEMFGPTGGFRGWPIQWNHAKCCGPTLVAMATKFGLGAEIQSPTGLFFFFFFLFLFSLLSDFRNPKDLSIHN